MAKNEQDPPFGSFDSPDKDIPIRNYVEFDVYKKEFKVNGDQTNYELMNSKKIYFTEIKEYNRLSFWSKEYGIVESNLLEEWAKTSKNKAEVKLYSHEKKKYLTKNDLQYSLRSQEKSNKSKKDETYKSSYEEAFRNVQKFIREERIRYIEKDFEDKENKIQDRYKDFLSDLSKKILDHLNDQNPKTEIRHRSQNIVVKKNSEKLLRVTHDLIRAEKEQSQKSTRYIEDSSFICRLSYEDDLGNPCYLEGLTMLRLMGPIRDSVLWFEIDREAEEGSLIELKDICDGILERNNEVYLPKFLGNLNKDLDTKLERRLEETKLIRRSLCCSSEDCEKKIEELIADVKKDIRDIPQFFEESEKHDQEPFETNDFEVDAFKLQVLQFYSNRLLHPETEIYKESSLILYHKLVDIQQHKKILEEKRESDRSHLGNHLKQGENNQRTHDHEIPCDLKESIKTMIECLKMEIKRIKDVNKLKSRHRFKDSTITEFVTGINKIIEGFESKVKILEAGLETNIKYNHILEFKKGFESLDTNLKERIEERKIEESRYLKFRLRRKLTELKDSHENIKKSGNILNLIKEIIDQDKKNGKDAKNLREFKKSLEYVDTTKEDKDKLISCFDNCKKYTKKRFDALYKSFGNHESPEVINYLQRIINHLFDRKGSRFQKARILDHFSHLRKQLIKPDASTSMGSYAFECIDIFRASLLVFILKDVEKMNEWYDNKEILLKLDMYCAFVNFDNSSSLNSSIYIEDDYRQPQPLVNFSCIKKFIAEKHQIFVKKRVQKGCENLIYKLKNIHKEEQELRIYRLKLKTQAINVKYYHLDDDKVKEVMKDLKSSIENIHEWIKDLLNRKDYTFEHVCRRKETGEWEFMQGERIPKTQKEYDDLVSKWEKYVSNNDTFRIGKQIKRSTRLSILKEKPPKGLFWNVDHSAGNASKKELNKKNNNNPVKNRLSCRLDMDVSSNIKNLTKEVEEGYEKLIDGLYNLKDCLVKSSSQKNENPITKKDDLKKLLEDFKDISKPNNSEIIGKIFTPYLDDVIIKMIEFHKELIALITNNDQKDKFLKEYKEGNIGDESEKIEYWLLDEEIIQIIEEKLNIKGTIKKIDVDEFKEHIEVINSKHRQILDIVDKIYDLRREESLVNRMSLYNSRVSLIDRYIKKDKFYTYAQRQIGEITMTILSSKQNPLIYNKVFGYSEDDGVVESNLLQTWSLVPPKEASTRIWSYTKEKYINKNAYYLIFDTFKKDISQLEELIGKLNVAELKSIFDQQTDNNSLKYDKLRSKTNKNILKPSKIVICIIEKCKSDNQKEYDSPGISQLELSNNALEEFEIFLEEHREDCLNYQIVCSSQDDSINFSFGRPLSSYQKLNLTSRHKNRQKSLLYLRKQAFLAPFSL